MAQKKYADLNSLQQFLIELKDTFSSMIHKHKLEDIENYIIDDGLSETSENPIKNKIITPLLSSSAFIDEEDNEDIVLDDYDKAKEEIYVNN